MKSRAFLWSLGIISCVTIFSIVIYSSTISNSKPKYESILNSFDNSYTPNNNKSEINTDKLFDLSSLAPDDNKNSQIRVKSGYESLSNYSERICYYKIKSGCTRILSEKTTNGCYAIFPIKIDGYKLNSSQIKKVMYAIRNDYPEFFWISSTFGYMYPKDSTVIKLNSTFSNQEREQAEKKLSEKVSNIISKSSRYKTDYEKELFFHNYLIEHCKYEMNYNNATKDSNIYTSYGCLVDGRAVCEGYSTAMQLLLNSVGIDARTVSGFRKNEPHMWNIVKINNKWYNLDVTWDGSGEFQRYFYFNVNDNIIKYDHEVNKQLGTQIWPEDKRYNFILPECNSNEHNYFEINAFKFSDLNNKSISGLTNYIIDCANKKCMYFYLMVPKNTKAKDIISQNNVTREIFKIIKESNKRLDLNHKIKNKTLNYSICNAQNVIVFKLVYN